MKNKKGPKTLLIDIETAPLLGYVWGLWDQTVGLNQIKTDWYILSWSAKWLGDPPNKTMYMDSRKSKNIENDKPLLQGVWELLDEADIIITQNGVRFDQKKLFARFVLSGMKRPSSFKHIDTFQIAKKHFEFTSNKLEYMSDKLCSKYKKLKHKKFPGFEMWRECLAGNQEAWKEMEKYNKHDVLALEELYTKLIPWDSTVNFSLYYDELDPVCTCGNKTFSKAGFAFLTSGKYQRYTCNKCGKETRSKENLFSMKKRRSLRLSTSNLK